MSHKPRRIYAGEASRKHSFHSRDVTTESNPVEPDRTTTTGSSTPPCSQVQKFYHKYGEDWLERYRLNQKEGIIE